MSTSATAKGAMGKYGLMVILILCGTVLLSCGGQKDGTIPKDGTIEEVEFVKGVEEKDNSEAPSMYDERYGTPIDDKEGKPKDDLVREPNEDEIFGFDE